MILEKLKYLFFDVQNDWQIGIIKSSLHSYIFTDNNSKIHWLKCKFNVYQADPFAIEKDGLIYLFYEEYLKEKKYAILKCSVYNSSLEILQESVILDDGTHKSFPLIFEFEGTFYMIPESGVISKLILYECVNFPFDWVEKKTIFNFPCSDSVMKNINGVWHLYYTKSNVQSENEKLFLRTSDNLFCDWNQEIEICIKNDLRSARNAGNIYLLNKKYFRFSQKCMNYYGESIVVNEIIESSEFDYKEVEIGEKKLIRKNSTGFHTLNATKNFVFVDRRHQRLKLKSFFSIIKLIASKINIYK